MMHKWQLLVVTMLMTVLPLATYGASTVQVEEVDMSDLNAMYRALDTITRSTPVKYLATDESSQPLNEQLASAITHYQNWQGKLEDDADEMASASNSTVSSSTSAVQASSSSYSDYVQARLNFCKKVIKAYDKAPAILYRCLLGLRVRDIEQRKYIIKGDMHSEVDCLTYLTMLFARIQTVDHRPKLAETPELLQGKLDISRDIVSKSLAKRYVGSQSLEQMQKELASVPGDCQIGTLEPAVSQRYVRMCDWFMNPDHFYTSSSFAFATVGDGSTSSTSVPLAVQYASNDDDEKEQEMRRKKQESISVAFHNERIRRKNEAKKKKELEIAARQKAVSVHLCV